MAIEKKSGEASAVGAFEFRRQALSQLVPECMFVQFTESLLEGAVICTVAKLEAPAVGGVVVKLRFLFPRGQRFDAFFGPMRVGGVLGLGRAQGETMCSGASA